MRFGGVFMLCEKPCMDKGKLLICLCVCLSAKVLGS